ncbi:hypothetical protein A1D22_09100 [Pasteurellaceae bacterium LFhippo2]|nr:hypothetical protein [Pasteurellaceae bacterium LFhippo2]
MKKLALIAIAMSVVACSSPPEPVAFPSNVKDSNLNNLVHTFKTPNVPLNRLDLEEWRYYAIAHGTALYEAEHAKTWYLAHHATDIEIMGNIDRASELRQLFISNGVKAKITLNATYSNANTLSITFVKLKPQPTNNTSKGVTL